MSSVADPVTEQIAALKPQITAALVKVDRSLTIQGICGQIGYYTNTPYCVIFAVDELAREGLVRWSQSSRRAQRRVEITDLGRAALAEGTGDAG